MYLVEFSYNNSYQATIQMAPYEALYGRKCRSPVYWDDVGERKLLGPELITRTVDVVEQIRRHMKTAQDRQRKWANIHRRQLKFQVGDHVFLKISLTRGVIRFGVRGKLSPRFVGPFDIIEKVGKVAYRLALPPALSGVHDVFHVSQLRRYIRDPSHVIDHSELEIRPDLSVAVQPIAIVDQREKVLKNKTIRLVRVQWDPQSPGDSTWELEERMREQYPHLFA